MCTLGTREYRFTEPVLGHPVLGHTVLGHPVLGHTVLGHPVLGHPVLGHPVRVKCHHAISRPTIVVLPPIWLRSV